LRGREREKAREEEREGDRGGGGGLPPVAVLFASHAHADPPVTIVCAWCGVRGSGFRVQGSGFRVQGSGFRVQGSGIQG